MMETIKANFTIGKNNNVAGVLECISASKEFSCWSSEFFHIEDHTNIYGKTHDNSYISLLNCLGGVSTHSTHNNSAYSCEIYSHTLILGNNNINPETDKFDSFSLVVGNPEKLFRSLKSFGYVSFPDKHLVDALNKQKYTPKFDIEKHPIVAYFNGDYDIFERKTKSGTITARNITTNNLSGDTTGVRIDNKVVIKIDFNEGVTLDEAYKRANSIAFFLRFVGGQGLYFKDITLKKIEDEYPEFHVLHDSFGWGVDAKKGYYSEPVVDVTKESFLDVLCGWFEKGDREPARASFYNTYFKKVYSSDRLITAANMFDILPASGKDKKLQLSSGAEELLLRLKVQIESEFSDFHDLRKSLLKSIGYTLDKSKKRNRKSLKERVQERLDIIEPYLIEHQIPTKDLEFIVSIAIKSRNYFVHGRQDKNLSSDTIFQHQALFIKTFEYIYALSELLESGWRVEDVPVWNSENWLRSCEQYISCCINDLREDIESR